MKTTILAAALMLITTLTFAQEDKYFGQNSTEALLEFESKSVVETSAASIEALMKNRTQFNSVRDQLETQVSHLIGHFQSQSFLEKFPYAGVLGRKYDFKFKSIKTIEGQSRLLSYKFKAKVNFHKDVFKSRRVVTVPLRIPLDISTIYSLGLMGDENKCTDHHYNSEGDFFYFWDPDMRGCPLKGNDEDVLRLDGKLTKLDNTKKTYPEYNRLYANKVLELSLFLGYIDDEISASRANMSDPVFDAYDAVKEELASQKFELEEEKKSFKVDYLGKELGKGINFLSVYSKKVKTDLGNEITVRVKVLVADTGMNIEDDSFHYFLKKAYEKSDIVYYDGHSGLGGNLSFDVLPKINFTSKYQIYFFNGCSSYPYYNDNYFDKKPGASKNLEILTSGLPTLSSTSADNMISFINPFINGETISYQVFLKRLEESSGDEDTYLFGVNGDEDNSFKP